MGPLCALWVVVTLLEALKGWAPSPLLAVAQVLKSFHKDKFQGEWFVLGLAGSTHSKADRSLLSPFTATFEQNAKNQLEVSYAMTRGNQRCITWSYVLISKAQPGKFSVENREPGADTEEVQVHNTDYTTFALMSSRRRSGSQSILRVHLLCRVWAIQTQLLDKFVCLVRAQGLLDANIVFPDLAEWPAHQVTC